MPTRSVLAAAALAVISCAAQATTAYGVTDTSTQQTLLRFDTATPGSAIAIGTITGMGVGETIRGVDFRPANGALYAVATSAAATDGHLYGIDLGTGLATAVGGGFTLVDNTSMRLSVDFNPVVDRLRVITGTGQSYRVNPNDGTLTAQDTSLDPGLSISGIAYANNLAGAASTTLYAYDYFGDTVGTVGGVNGVPSPNLGGYTVIGKSGIASFSAAAGMDISGFDGLAYFMGDDSDSADGRSEFYRVDLGTGKLALQGSLPVAAIDFSLVTTAAVPEPGSWALMLTGAGCLAWRRRRRLQGCEQRAGNCSQ